MVQSALGGSRSTGCAVESVAFGHSSPRSNPGSALLSGGGVSECRGRADRSSLRRGAERAGSLQESRPAGAYGLVGGARDAFGRHPHRGTHHLHPRERAGVFVYSGLDRCGCLECHGQFFRSRGPGAGPDAAPQCRRASVALASRDRGMARAGSGNLQGRRLGAALPHRMRQRRELGAGTPSGCHASNVGFRCLARGQGSAFWATASGDGERGRCGVPVGGAA